MSLQCQRSVFPTCSALRSSHRRHFRRAKTGKPDEGMTPPEVVHKVVLTGFKNIMDEEINNTNKLNATCVLKIRGIKSVIYFVGK